ncbi:hypothetical protein [Arthrobacter sp. 49Tsu3.1M3]|uniref:hypothetical protein n=1 Tax=Arthrobacter sp. 49Tsu3.1M3 TaxID=1279029 RepID=UPI0009A6D83B|nr:hypothetical protein [Arthrobacter sp. 49Tsu3.1M3]
MKQQAETSVPGLADRGGQPVPAAGGVPPPSFFLQSFTVPAGEFLSVSGIISTGLLRVQGQIPAPESL